MNASVAVSEHCGSVMMRVSKQRTGGVFCPSKWSAAVSKKSHLTMRTYTCRSLHHVLAVGHFVIQQTLDPSSGPAA